MARSLDRPPNLLPRRHVVTTLLVLMLLIASGVLFRLSNADLGIWDAGDNPAPTRLTSQVPRGSDDNQQPAASLPAPAPTPTMPPAVALRSPAALPAQIAAKVEIVWPHDNLPVREASLVNVTVFLFAEEGMKPVACNAVYTVRLWRALNAGAARPIAVGQKRMFIARGHTFPVWDFNDVDVSAGRDPANRLVFYATVDGLATKRNIWVHAADARTVYPEAELPKRVKMGRPELIEAHIEILWPHDNLPPARAQQANVSAYLFDADTGEALSPEHGSWLPTVRLHWTANSDADRGTDSSVLGRERRVSGANGIAFSAWDFDDVDISLARDSLNKIHFWVEVEGTPTLSSVWTHGAAAPTLFPQTDLPASCE